MSDAFNIKALSAQLKRGPAWCEGAPPAPEVKPDHYEKGTAIGTEETKQLLDWMVAMGATREASSKGCEKIYSEIYNEDYKEITACNLG